MRCGLVQSQSSCTWTGRISNSNSTTYNCIAISGLSFFDAFKMRVGEAFFTARIQIVAMEGFNLVHVLDWGHIHFVRLLLGNFLLLLFFAASSLLKTMTLKMEN